MGRQGRSLHVCLNVLELGTGGIYAACLVCVAEERFGRHLVLEVRLDLFPIREKQKTSEKAGGGAAAEEVVASKEQAKDERVSWESEEREKKKECYKGRRDRKRGASWGFA